MKVSNHAAAAAGATLLFSMITAYAWAQGKPAPAEKKPAPAAAHADAGAGPACARGDCKHGEGYCPMADLHALVDVKVEKTKTGAVVQLTAKDPAKVAEVQALAEKITEHMKSGSCGMEEGAGHAHGPGHHPGHPPAPTK
jgi:hypothetical protein